MEREVHSILGPFGIKKSMSCLITEQLSSIEQDSSTEGTVRRDTETGTDAAAADTGLTFFLLNLGEGMGKRDTPITADMPEAAPISRLWTSALTIGFSYFVGGLIPLIPYMAHINAQTGLIVSACVTGTVLFIFGAFKTYFTGAKGGWKGYLYGAVSTLIVGALGAGAAYGLVRAMNVKE